MFEKAKYNLGRWLMNNSVSRKQYRSYSVVRDPHVADWKPVSLSADKELRDAIVDVRAKARDLENNDNYAKKYIRMCINNVIGPNGYTFQSKVRKPNGELDNKANDIIEELWDDFCTAPTADGKLSFLGFLELAITYYYRDGENITRFIKNYPHNEHKFALQIIEPDILDERLVSVKDNGNIIRLGIELDPYQRPANYYFKNVIPGNNFYYETYATNHTIIPSDEIVHLYKKSRITQTRGISHLVQSMLELKMLNGYNYAALINARIGASKMGFFERNETSEPYTGDSADDSGHRIMNATPGTFEELPVGTKLTMWNPQFPEQQHESYIRTLLRGIASGLGISYNSFANDLVGVNYSSIRAGLLDERVDWQKEQNYVRDMLLVPIQNELIKWWYVTGKLDKIKGYSIKQLQKRTNTGKRWPWVDPLKDVTANIKAIEAGLKSRASVIDESDQNADIYDILEQLQIELKLIEQYKLDYMIPKKTNKSEDINNAK